MNEKLLEELIQKEGFYEFDYSLEEDADFVLRSLGGEASLKANYPLVYEAFQKSVQRTAVQKSKNEKTEKKVSVGIDTLTTKPSGNEAIVCATVSGLFADPDYTAENLLKGEAPRPWLSGNLSFSIYNYHSPVETYCNDSYCFQKTDNFQTQYQTDNLELGVAKECASTILLHALDPNGCLKTFSHNIPLMGNALNVVDTFSIEDPGSSFGNNPIIMLYGRTREQNESYMNADYYNNGPGGEYYDNKPDGKKLKTIMPLKGKIKLMPGCEFLPAGVLHKPVSTDPLPFNQLIRSNVKVGGMRVATMYEDLNDDAAYTELQKCFTTDTSGAHPTVCFDIIRGNKHDWHSDTDGVGDWQNNVMTYLLNGGFVLDIKDPNKNLMTVQFSVTSKAIESMSGKQYYVSNSNQVYVPPIIVHWGCFAREVPVRLATGEDRRIDELKKGDLVVTSDGRAVTFSEMVTGEAGKLFKIQTESGGIRLTGGHPVLLVDGTAKAAGLIEPGDILMTPCGESRVLENREEEYDDLVYSPIFAESGEDGLFILAGGFYCGDYFAQNRPKSCENKLTDKQKSLIEQFKDLCEVTF